MSQKHLAQLSSTLALKRELNAQQVSDLVALVSYGRGMTGKQSLPSRPTQTPVHPRVQALRSLDILDSDPDPAYDDVVRLAAQVCQAPIARVSLVDEHREWFKASIGSDACEAPTNDSICARAIEHNELFVVPDLTVDPRFREFSTVRNAPFFRFYAGAPLTMSSGEVIGMLCVLDIVPRPEGLSPSQADALRALARSVMTLIELRSVNLQLRESQDHYTASVDLSSQIPWTADPSGNILEVGPKWRQLVGMAADETLGTGWVKALHPDDRAPTAKHWARILASGEPLDMEYRVQLQEGEYRWFRAQARPRRRPDGSIMRWYGSLEDIHGHKLARQELERSEVQFRDMADNAPFMVWVTEPDGACTYLSRSWFEFTGQTPATAYGAGWLDAVHPEDRLRSQTAFMEATRTHKPFREEYRLRRYDGSYCWTIDASTPRMAPDGTFLGFIGSVIDISDRKAAEEQLSRTNKQLQAVLETTLDNVVILDRQWRIEYMNEQAIASLGGGVPLVGHDLRQLVSHPDFMQNYARAMDGGNPVHFEAFSRTFDKWFSSRAVAVPDGLIIFLNDITDRKQAWDLIERQARHDALTGLPNRATFREALTRKLNEREPVAVLLLDLDDFKSINDTYGHPVGDELLCLISATLSQHIPADCLLARLGGDEFALLFEGKEEALQLAEEINRVLAQSFDVSGRRVWTGVSIGIAMAPEDGSSADEVISNADIALYSSKAAGGGRAQRFHRAEQERIVLRESLKQDLSTALEKNELWLAYQPQFDLKVGRLKGFEALLRWAHPGRGQIPPLDFVTLAEETGLIEGIGAWVLEEACRTAADWPSDIGISVNLSPIQFRSAQLPLHVLRAIGASKIQPNRLKLEVTESVLLDNSASNLKILGQFREIGTQVSLDDFGTGFSSLSYLRSFQFDEIKIDRSFVSDIGKVPQSEAIIAAIASLARSLQMEVTAEGVETEWQRQWLLSRGIETAQGYLFGRPMNKEAATMLLNDVHGNLVPAQDVKS